MTAETNVEERLRLAVKTAGGRCLKMPAILYRGIPDRLVLLKGGQVWFLELKKDGAPTTRKVKPAQSAWATFLQDNGFNYGRLVGMADVEEFIREHIEDPVRSPGQ